MGPIRPTTATVDLGALRRNFEAVRARVAPRVKVLAAVKGDAYGHGAVPVARALEAAGCDALGVALVEEAALLRDSGVALPILCLGGVGRHGAAEAVARDLAAALYDEGDAERLDAAARARGTRARVHLKVDTGMGRLGVPLPGWERFLDRIAGFDGLHVEGLFTHFAEGEATDVTFTEEQLRRFRRAAAAARSRGVAPTILHAANSGALLQHPSAHFDMVRPGIALYGYPPGGAMQAEAVMRVATQVLFVRDLPAGAPVSYGRRFVTARPSRVATLPVGYADGYPRALGGRASVLLGGQRCPVVGTVCMDLAMVDVTDLPVPVESGDEAVLLGEQAAARIDAAEIAGWADTIPYEVLTGFTPRVPRLHA